MTTRTGRLPIMNTILGATLVAAVLAPGPVGLGQGAGGTARPTLTLTAQSTVPTAVSAYAPTTADQRIVSALNARVTGARFGNAFSGAVIDVGSGTTLWTRNGTTGRLPASTTKLVTATSALNVFGAAYRFTTTVKRGGQADQVILVGSGDPGLASSHLATLAAGTAARMKAAGQPRVRVYVDDRLFAAPSLATGWKSTYVPADTTWLRALVVDGRDVSDTSIDAARIFAAKLAANGVAATVVGRTTTNAQSPLLASVQGWTLNSSVTRMLLESDNEYAEALHRLVAVHTGYGNTWAAGRAAQSRQLALQGLSATALYDGSGLSRSDRLTAIQLAQTVTNAFEPANSTRLALLRSTAGLPSSGQTGTLAPKYKRFASATSRCAVGKVHAKTGTLTDSTALAGWTVGRDGRVKAFAFVANGTPSTATLRANIDMIAATVNGCY